MILTCSGVYWLRVTGLAAAVPGFSAGVSASVTGTVRLPPWPPVVPVPANSLSNLV